VRLGRAADHSPPYSAAVMEEYSYTPSHPLGHAWPVTESLYLYLAWTGRGNDNLSPLLTQETYALKIIQQTANFLPQNRLLHNLSSDRD